MKNKIISLLLKVLILSLFSIHSHSSEQNWKPAQEGNKVILIRHSLAPGGGDPAGFKINDCKTQRNLNRVGINQSKKIGNLFKIFLLGTLTWISPVKKESSVSKLILFIFTFILLEIILETSLTRPFLSIPVSFKIALYSSELESTHLADITR